MSRIKDNPYLLPALIILAAQVLFAVVVYLVC